MAKSHMNKQKTYLYLRSAVSPRSMRENLTNGIRKLNIPHVIIVFLVSVLRGRMILNKGQVNKKGECVYWPKKEWAA